MLKETCETLEKDLEELKLDLDVVSNALDSRDSGKFRVARDHKDNYEEIRNGIIYQLKALKFVFLVVGHDIIEKSDSKYRYFNPTDMETKIKITRTAIIISEDVAFMERDEDIALLDGLHIEGDLDLSYLIYLDYLPEGLNVSGDLKLPDFLNDLPKTMRVGGDLLLEECSDEIYSQAMLLKNEGHIKGEVIKE